MAQPTRWYPVRRHAQAVAVVAAAVIVFVATLARHFEKVHFALSERPCADPGRIQAITTEVANACRRLGGAGVTYWLHHGTLLGAVREGGRILPHDKDADIGYLVADMDKVLAAVGTRFGRRGAMAHTDLMRYDADRGANVMRVALAEHESDPVNVVNAWRTRMPLDWFLPTSPLGGGGPLAHCAVPARPEKILEWLYGSSWAEPVACTPPGGRRSAVSSAWSAASSAVLRVGGFRTCVAPCTPAPGT